MTIFEALFTVTVIGTLVIMMINELVMLAKGWLNER